MSSSSHYRNEKESNAALLRPIKERAFMVLLGFLEERGALFDLPGFPGDQGELIIHAGFPTRTRPSFDKILEPLLRQWIAFLFEGADGQEVGRVFSGFVGKIDLRLGFLKLFFRLGIFSAQQGKPAAQNRVQIAVNFFRRLSANRFRISIHPKDIPHKWENPILDR